MAVTYAYKGILANKYTEGKVIAINKDEAAFKLKEDKIIITSLEKVSGKEEVIKAKKEVKESKKKTKIPKKVPIERSSPLLKNLRQWLGLAYLFLRP